MGFADDFGHYACCPSLPRKGEWETREGELLEIENMATSHIKNTISFLKRKQELYFCGCEDYDGKISEFKLELRLRGD